MLLVQNMSLSCQGRDLELAEDVMGAAQFLGRFMVVSPPFFSFSLRERPNKGKHLSFLAITHNVTLSADRITCGDKGHLFVIRAGVQPRRDCSVKSGHTFTR